MSTETYETECHACIVDVWTGPESHSGSCPLRNTVRSSAVRHEIRTEEFDGRTGWVCSCGHSGSVGEGGDVDIASDKHIDHKRGDTRVDSSASPDAPWAAMS